jgi:GxxExxY protein
MQHEELTEKVIGAAYEVHNTLGSGFLEKIYENALALELRRLGLNVEQQKPVAVHYKGELVGDYVADIVMEGTVILEVKAASAIETPHEVQLVNYLKATGIEVGLLINFGRKVEVKRKVFDRIE